MTKTKTIELPCLPGDTVYVLGFPYDGTVRKEVVDKVTIERCNKFIISCPGAWHGVWMETVFPTKKAAFRKVEDGGLYFPKCGEKMDEEK